MKDSGVPWIGAVPTNWTRLRIKDVCRTYLGKASKKANQYVGLEHITPWLGTYQAADRAEAEASTGQLIAAGVMCFSKLRPYLAKAFVANEALFVTTELLTFVPRSTVVDAGYLTRYVLTHGFIATVNDAVAGTKMPRVDWPSLSTQTIFLPPISEQRTIADYLDQQTVLIDQRLSTLEKKKIVLAELRKATIHEVVTKGLNKNALMKNSGVAWLGLVPSHWTIARFKDVAKLNPSTSLPKSDEIDFFPMEAIGVDGGLTFGQRKPVSQASGYSQIKNGDVCFAKVTPCFENGKSAIVEGLEFGVALATTEITILRPNKKINRHFLHYRIKGLDFAMGGASEMKGAGGLKRVPERFAAEFVFQLPPLTEQLAIANHLDQQTQKIDAQLATLDEQVMVLKELRKAIIHEAVTGKIDLSGVESGLGA